MIEMIAKIIKILNSETEPAQISLAACFAMVVGFTPLWSLHNVFVLLLVLMMRVNLSTFILTWGAFSAIAYLMDPVFHAFGLFVLTADILKSFWTILYNNIWFRLTGFNHSITMGSFLVTLILFIPMLLLLNFSIRKYRSHILAWIEKLSIFQIIRASKIYQKYQDISAWGGRS